MNLKNKINSINKKDLLRGISGTLIIILVLIANGFMSFITVGFAFEKILTASYWASFSILLASELSVLFGMYLIQKGRDLKKKKITDIQDEIDKQRRTIYVLDKVAVAVNWLKDVYNYQIKLDLYEDKIKSIYESLRVKEPQKEDKNYNKKKIKYDKIMAQKTQLLEQLDFIKKDRKRLNLIINKSDTHEIAELNETLNTDKYKFRTAKIHYKPIYWGNLLSDVEETKTKPVSAFFDEKIELTKSVSKYIATGLLSAGFVSCLIFPTFNSLGWNTVLSLLVNLVTLIVFMIKGIGLSNKIILGKYYKALESRKSIYTKMLKDLGVSKIVIEDEDVNETENLG